MGTEVHCKSYLPGYYSMRDMNEDSNSSSWPLFYGDKTLTNGQYYNSFLPRTVTDSYPGYNKDVLKQKMLEHEAIFKNQVYELHRVYRIQRDLMEEVKKRELHKHQISIETSSSSSLLPSQLPSEDAQKWHIPSFPLANPNYARPSMVGAEVITSPLSCTKGKSIQTSRVQYQNGCASKDCEVLECRPSKVRKKLFDLQLPADEYIDTEEGEQLQDNKISDISSYFPNGVVPERGVKLALGGGKKINSPGVTSASDSFSRKSFGLADLNEPIQVEAATAPTSVDILGRSGDIRVLDLAAKPRSQGLPRDFVQNFQHGSNIGTSNNLFVENKDNGREWLTNLYEAGNSKSNLNSIPQHLQPDKLHTPSHPSNLNFIPQCFQPDKLPIPSHSSRPVFNKAHQPLGNFPTDHSRGDLWSEKKGRAIEISDRSHAYCNYNNPESVVASRISSSYPFANSSDLANSWSHSVSSWGKPNSSLTQKLASVQTNPSFNSSASLNRNSQPSDQSHEIFGGKWHVNGSSKLNPGLSSELPGRNGFYHGSSSGFDYLPYNKVDNMVSERVINHVSENFLKGSNFVELKSTKDMNLNVVPKDSSNEAVPQQGLEIIDEKSTFEEHLAALPWLSRAKPPCKNDATSSRRDLNSAESGDFQDTSNQLAKNETAKDPNHIFTRDIGSRKEMGDCQGKRILGFPIFENPRTSQNESALLVSSSASLHCPPEGEEIKFEGKHRLIDINVACDPTFPDSGKQTSAESLVVEKGTDTEVTNFRNFIDLNSCFSEDEDQLAPSVVITSARVKIAVEIDLEAPVILETEEAIVPGEEHKQDEAVVEHPEDEFARTAAEAIVAISSSDQHEATWHPSEASLADSLLWFSEVVSSCVDDDDAGKESGGGVEVFPTCEIDYFEAMTLQLTETKEEDYMPKTLVAETREVEETGATSLPNRSRKANPRRGRQRRDFQKDILPGLTSLSRHEITEDLQTFGGLMRATGHVWQSGSTRRNGTRNGSARGRRRLVVDPPPPPPPVVASPVRTPLLQHLISIEVGLKDRSLTGWGKTTRRPRRQRCPAGNPVAVALT